VTAASAGGAQTITSANAVTVTATSPAGNQAIITGAGADVITASTAAAINTIMANAGNDYPQTATAQIKSDNCGILFSPSTLFLK